SQLQKLAVLLLIPLIVTTLPGRPQSSSSIGNPVKIEKKILNNGVTVLLIEDHSAPVISCQVYSKLGTRDEPADASGSAFLIGRSALGRVDYIYREGTGLVLEGDETTSAVINQDFIGLLLRGSIDKLDSMAERASTFASFDNLNREFASKYKTVLDQNAIESSQITGAGQSLRTFAY